jgi:hypothetical protein
MVYAQASKIKRRSAEAFDEDVKIPREQAPKSNLMPAASRLLEGAQLPAHRLSCPEHPRDTVGIPAEKPAVPLTRLPQALSQATRPTTTTLQQASAPEPSLISSFWDSLSSYRPGQTLFSLLAPAPPEAKKVDVTSTHAAAAATRTDVREDKGSAGDVYSDPPRRLAPAPTVKYSALQSAFAEPKNVAFASPPLRALARSPPARPVVQPVINRGRSKGILKANAAGAPVSREAPKEKRILSSDALRAYFEVKKQSRVPHRQCPACKHWNQHSAPGCENATSRSTSPPTAPFRSHSLNAHGTCGLHQRRRRARTLQSKPP